MIRYLRHDEIDKARWDEAILRSRNGMLYAHSWFLDIASPRWEALVENDYAAVMPLTWRKKAGIRYVCQPSFTQQLGIFSSRKLQAKDTANFLAALPAEIRYADIFLNAGNSCETDPVIKIFSRITHHLDLQPADPGVSMKYSENLRRNLKKAAIQDLQPVSIGIDELVRLFRKHRGRTVSTLRTGDYAVLKKLVGAAEKRGLATLTGLRRDGKLLAGACFLESDHEYIFFFSATSEEGKKSGAMSCIIDRFIRGQVGEKVLDFEGSMDKNLSRFYKSFGAHEIVYLHIQSNRLPRVLRWLKK